MAYPAAIGGVNVRGIRMARLIVKAGTLLRSLSLLRMDIGPRCFMLRLDVGTRRLMALRRLRTMLRNVAATDS